MNKTYFSITHFYNNKINMKHLLIIPVLFANFAFAEIYEDYEPSKQVTELTVISVQPNYMDNYLVNLKKTWVRSSEIQNSWIHPQIHRNDICDLIDLGRNRLEVREGKFFDLRYFQKVKTSPFYNTKIFFQPPITRRSIIRT